MTDKPAVGKLAFVEFGSPEPARLAAVFERIGMTEVARHRHRDATRHRQGDVNTPPADGAPLHRVLAEERAKA